MKNREAKPLTLSPLIFAHSMAAHPTAPPQLLATLSGHTDRVWCVSWSPDGTTLASCGADKTIRLWTRDTAPNTWTCKVILEDAHERTVRRVAWFPDGTKLAAASFDGTVSVWRRTASTWEVGAVLEGHENEVKCVDVDQAGIFLATCGRDKTVWIWELMDVGSGGGDAMDTDAGADEGLQPLEFECADLKRGHGGDVKSVVWHPCQPFFVSTSYDDSIRVWAHDPARDEWRCAQELADTASGGSAGHKGTVWNAAFEPMPARRDANAECRLATCSDDRGVIVWSATAAPGATADDPPQFHVQQSLADVHERSVLSIDWSRTGVFATGGSDDAICVYREAGLNHPFERVARVEHAHEGDVNCVTFCPAVGEDGSALMATAGDDKMVRLWTI